MKTFARSLLLALMELLVNCFQVLLEITCCNPKEKMEELPIGVKMKLLRIKKVDTAIFSTYISHLILKNGKIIRITEIYTILPVDGW